MSKVDMFRKMLRGKHLLKLIDERELTIQEKEELKELIRYFGERGHMDNKERETITKKHNISKSKLDIALE